MSPDPRANMVEHGGALAEACARYGGHPKDWLDLSTGINPRPVSLPDLPLSAWHRLPERELFQRAAEAAAGRYSAPANVVPVVTPGIQSVIQILPELLCGPVAVLGPTYEEYALCFARHGHDVETVADLSDIRPDHKVVVVVNPNNPNGRTHSRDVLLELHASLKRRNGTLIVDEAFADMRPDLSLAPHTGTKGLVVLRSFGKFFGLAGLRLGFALTDRETGEALSDRLGPWSVSGPALMIADKVLRDADLVSRTADQISTGRKALESVLADSQLQIAGGTDLFVLARHAEAESIHQELCQRHILTRAFSYKHDWLRFGLCPDQESIQRLGDALESIG